MKTWPLAPQFENLGSCCGFWRLGQREVALSLPVELVDEESPLEMLPRSALISLVPPLEVARGANEGFT